MTSSSRSPVVWAVFFGVPALHSIAAGLAAQAARVALIGDGAAASIPGVLSLTAPPADREGLAAAFADAKNQLGAPDLVVVACGSPEALMPAALDSLPAEAWRQQAQAPMRQALQVVQTILPQLPDGGRIAMLGPSIAMIGAPQLAPLVASLEGQRGLLKAAARQWGARGIRLNWVSVGAEIYAPELANVTLPVGPELGPPPLPIARPDLEHDTAAMLLMLASPGAAALTGATINLDGGEWMLP